MWNVAAVCVGIVILVAVFLNIVAEMQAEEEKKRKARELTRRAYEYHERRRRIELLDAQDAAAKRRRCTGCGAAGMSADYSLCQSCRNVPCTGCGRPVGQWGSDSSGYCQQCNGE